MAPVTSKTNFKSYESQARLLRAIVAAHPEVKWNYKEIVKHYGSDMTEHALNHRFRAIKAHVGVVKDAAAQGVDCLGIPADLPKNQKDIAKFFGESTADGIQFQFRGIKKDAESLKQTANSGGNPATALNLPASGTSSAFSTPRKATPSKPRASGGGRSTAKKTKAIKTQPPSDDEDEDDGDEVDYNALEDTPTKSRIRNHVVDGRVSKNAGSRSNTPSRAATIAAARYIAQEASIDLTSDSEVNTPDNTAGYESVPVDVKPAVMRNQSFEQPAARPVPQPVADDYAGPHSIFGHDSGADLLNGHIDPMNLSFANSSQYGSAYGDSQYGGGLYGNPSYLNDGDGEI